MLEFHWTLKIDAESVGDAEDLLGNLLAPHLQRGESIRCWNRSWYNKNQECYLSNASVNFEGIDALLKKECDKINLMEKQMKDGNQAHRELLDNVSKMKRDQTDLCRDLANTKGTLRITENELTKSRQLVESLRAIIQSQDGQRFPGGGATSISQAGTSTPQLPGGISSVQTTDRSEGSSQRSPKRKRVTVPPLPLNNIRVNPAPEAAMAASTATRPAPKPALLLQTGKAVTSNVRQMPQKKSNSC